MTTDKWQTTLKLVVLRVCLIYTSSIRVSHQTVAVIKPDQLHVHVMIIMFINSLRHVFYHVHSCSCHVYIASSSWALNTLTFAEFLFLQVSRPTRFRPRMCFVRGSQPKSTRMWKVGMSAWPELTAKTPRSFFHPKWEGLSWKHIGTHFVKMVCLTVSLASFRDGKWNYVFIWFLNFSIFEGCQSLANLENHHHKCSATCSVDLFWNCFQFKIWNRDLSYVVCGSNVGRVGRRIIHFTNSGNLEAQDQTKNGFRMLCIRFRTAKGCVVWFLDFLGVYKQAYRCDVYTFAITCFHQVRVSMIQPIRNYWPFNQCDYTSAGSCSVGDLWWTPPQKSIYIYIFL